METDEFIDACALLRKEVKDIGEKVIILKGHSVFDSLDYSGDRYGEMKANITLAYRHLEDARMRLGKAIQAYDGGKSAYDR